MKPDSPDESETAPLDPELAKWIASERWRGPAPAEAQQEVLLRIEAALGGAVGTTGTTGASGSAATTAIRRIALSRAGALAMGTFLVGGAGGAWLRGEAAPRVVYVDRPVAASVGAQRSPAGEPPLPAISIDALPSAPLVVLSARRPRGVEDADAGSAQKSYPTSTSLSAEQALVETGRTALVRGDRPSALVALDRHAAQFPNGQLAEEREVLAVRALVGAHREQEAAERAARFRLKYPESVMIPLVDQALR